MSSSPVDTATPQKSSPFCSSAETPDILFAKLREIIAKRSASKAEKKPEYGPKCIKKWVEVPADIIDSYDMAQMTKCVSCHKKARATVYAIPYVVHDITGDYTCFKCGESCNIKYMCPYCNGSLNKQLQRNNRDARSY